MNKSSLDSINETIAAKELRPQPVAPSVSGGDAIPNEVAGGESVTVSSGVEQQEFNKRMRRRIPLLHSWRYRLLRPTCIPVGSVVMRSLKTFKSVQPIAISTWDDNPDQSMKMRILREHRAQTAAVAHRSEYDREYDKGRVKKVKNKQRIVDRANCFQDVVNKRIRSS